jgi:hypothetical protein
MQPYGIWDHITFIVKLFFVAATQYLSLQFQACYGLPLVEILPPKRPQSIPSKYLPIAYSWPSSVTNDTIKSLVSSITWERYCFSSRSDLTEWGCYRNYKTLYQLRKYSEMWETWNRLNGCYYSIILVVAPCILKIHWVLHTNKCTNYISHISLKLYTLKHCHCSYIFR